MSQEHSKFQIPRNIERYLGALSRLYAHEQNRLLQEIIVNGRPRIHEVSSSWNNEIGHLLYLSIPEPLYFQVVNERNSLQEQIKKDFIKVHSVQDEFLEGVFLEMEVGDGSGWREESGLLITATRVVAPDATKRIWDDGTFRVFLSHKSEVKQETAALKERLRPFGISCFVAHEDIHPTKAWQDEIENALASMDGFIALLTEGFHDSNWTDQEVGFAFARGVPMLALRLGRDPYGFIGKFQGLATTWQNAATDICKILLKNDQVFSAYIYAMRNCENWDTGNKIAAALPCIASLNPTQIDELVAAYNDTSELQGSFGFNGKKLREYGAGLVPHLNRLGSRRFQYTANTIVEVSPSV